MKVIYAKASVERKPEFRQHTIILQDSGKRIVRKVAAGSAAQQHIREYILNHEKLTKAAAADGRVKAISCKENKDGSVEFPFCTDVTLAELLTDKKPAEYIRTVSQFREALIQTYGMIPFEPNEQFKEFFGKTDDIADNQALCITNADLNFDNIFCSEAQNTAEDPAEYTMIDYEWILPFPVPISFLFYRAFLLDPSFNQYSEDEQKKIFESFDITKAIVSTYQTMEAAFLNYISPEEEKLDYYARNETKITKTQHTLEHLLHLPEENQRLSKDLERELKTAVGLSEELGKEQQNATHLSDELGKTQQQVVRLSTELGDTQKKFTETNQKLLQEQKRTEELSDELGETRQKYSEANENFTRELKNALWLSDELGKTQKEYSELIDQYNYFGGKIWFRFFRKLDGGKRRIGKKLRDFLKKHHTLRRGVTFFRFMKENGLKATTEKTKGYLDKKKAEKTYIEKVIDAEKQTAEKDVVFPKKIKFSILVPLYNTPRDFLVEMIQSVQNQTYGNWELCLADGSTDDNTEVGEICKKMAEEDPRIVYHKLEKNLGISGNTNACIEMASGDYIALFDHDDLLHPSALFENMKAICEQDADFIYSDEVVFVSPDIHNLLATHFKPDFAPDNLLSNNYICHFSVFKRTLLDKAGWFREECNGSQDHDIILRLTGVANKVVHIPKVLYYWRSHPTSVASDISTKTYAIDAGRFAVSDFLKTRKEIQADVVSTDVYPTMYHVKYPLSGKPLANIIIDLYREEEPEMKAEGIISAFTKRTGYGNVSITFLCDKSVDSSKEHRFPVSWIKTNQEKRPARFNEAWRSSDADYYVFIDKDIIPQNNDWLEEMLILAQQKHIGTVGARIEFDDTSLRHGGLIIGLGRNRLAGRSHFRVGHENGGYFGQLAIVEDVSAVSVECMMIRKELLAETGGFPEQYNETLFDVDLCLKLRKEGYYNVYTPFACFKGGDSGKYSMEYGTEWTRYQDDAEILTKEWEEEIHSPDPFYNPNLTLDFSDYRIREDL